MTVQSTGSLPNSIHSVYMNRYIKGSRMARLYDMFAVPYDKFMSGRSMKELMRGNQIDVPFLSDMSPATEPISQTVDIPPQTLEDAVASVTSTSRAGALQWPQELEIKVYTPYTAEAYEKVGANMQESIELLAQAAALTGSWVERPAARSSLDAGNAAHRISDTVMRKNAALMQTLKVPGIPTGNTPDDESGTQNWIAGMHPFTMHDLQESGDVKLVGDYQVPGIHLNWEMGKIGFFRCLVSAWFKVFGAAGAANGTAVSTTLAQPAKPLDTTIVTAADVSANIGAGLLWTVGNTETGNTHNPRNEQVRILSASGTTLTILGTGPNGGLRYRHDAGEAVKNADTVYPVILGGPQSLVKVWAVETGPRGQIVGPKKHGTVDQWTILGWKWFGGYGLLAANRIVRLEFASSFDA